MTVSFSNLMNPDTVKKITLGKEGQHFSHINVTGNVTVVQGDEIPVE